MPVITSENVHSVVQLHERQRCSQLQGKMFLVGLEGIFTVPILPSHILIVV